MAFTKPAPGVRPRSLRTRFGLFSLLVVREFFYYLVTQYACLVAALIITQWPRNPTELARLVFFQFPLSEWFFIIR